jgi:hypothetical protein
VRLDVFRTLKGYTHGGGMVIDVLLNIGHDHTCPISPNSAVHHQHWDAWGELATTFPAHWLQQVSSMENFGDLYTVLTGLLESGVQDVQSPVAQAINDTMCALATCGRLCHPGEQLRQEMRLANVLGDDDDADPMDEDILVNLPSEVHLATVACLRLCTQHPVALRASFVTLARHCAAVHLASMDARVMVRALAVFRETEPAALAALWNQWIVEIGERAFCSHLKPDDEGYEWLTDVLPALVDLVRKVSDGAPALHPLAAAVARPIGMLLTDHPKFLAYVDSRVDWTAWAVSP